MSKKRKPIKLGTVTKYGTVKAIVRTGGERYYMLIDKSGIVSLFHADVVEGSVLRG